MFANRAMFAKRAARLKAICLPTLVIVAVWAVVGWAAHSTVNWPPSYSSVGRSSAGSSSAGGLQGADRSSSPGQAAKRVAGADIREAVDDLDRLLEARWREAGVTPASDAEDLQIVRRMSLALCGTIPSLEEIRVFEADGDADRLDRWTTRLLADNRFADYFAERLARCFVGTEAGQPIIFRRDRFVDWLRHELAQNTPYDELARRVISETGLWTDHPATNYITSAMADGQLDENKLAGRTARAFLGQRMDCAQCHDHPFGQWKQQQFQGLAALFGQAQSSIVGVEDKAQLKYEVEDRKTLAKRVVQPAVPFHAEWLPTEGTRRQQLAAWVTHPQNRRFERATVNRVWGLVFGKPLHSPVDDLPDPSEAHGQQSAGLNSALAAASADRDILDVLGADFRAHHCDLRRLIRVIAASRAFRLDSAQAEQSPKVPSADRDENAEMAATAAGETSPPAAFPMTRLRPEQLIGSILQATSLRTIDQNSHLFVRFQRFTQQNEFVTQYGDLGDNELDERSGTLAQALLRMNGKLASDALRTEPLNASSRIVNFADTDAKCLETCYLVALTRRPTPAETAYFLPQLAAAGKSGQKGGRAQAVEDTFWSLFNSPEFSWNH